MKEVIREHIVEKLREFVSKESGLSGIKEETALIASGVLDSFLIMSIISYCEREFSCAIGPDEFEEKHFRTIGTLADQLCGHLQKQLETRILKTPDGTGALKTEENPG